MSKKIIAKFNRSIAKGMETTQFIPLLEGEVPPPRKRGRKVGSKDNYSRGARQDTYTVDGKEVTALQYLLNKRMECRNRQLDTEKQAAKTIPHPEGLVDKDGKPIMFTPYMLAVYQGEGDSWVMAHKTREPRYRGGSGKVFDGDRM